MAKAVELPGENRHDSTALGRGFRRRIEAGDLLLGGMIMQLLDPAIVKLYSYAGFDFIYMDNEHVLMAGTSSMASFVMAARDNGLPVIAKCPELARPEVARLLEAGVSGIQLPRTESRQDMATLVDFVKFPPVGSRAAAPLFGNVDYAWPSDIEQWLVDTNAATFIVAHIETRKGLENIDEIVSTPGVDMLYIGPLDFAISMGRPNDPDHPEVIDAMQRVLAACVKNNVVFGTTCRGPAMAGQWVAKGARFFEVVDELSLIAKGAGEFVDAYRQSAAPVEDAV